MFCRHLSCTLLLSDFQNDWVNFPLLISVFCRHDGRGKTDVSARACTLCVCHSGLSTGTVAFILFSIFSLIIWQLKFIFELNFLVEKSKNLMHCNLFFFISFDKVTFCVTISNLIRCFFCAYSFKSDVIDMWWPVCVSHIHSSLYMLLLLNNQ